MLYVVASATKGMACSYVVIEVHTNIRNISYISWHERLEICNKHLQIKFTYLCYTCCVLYFNKERATTITKLMKKKTLVNWLLFKNERFINMALYLIEFIGLTR